MMPKETTSIYEGWQRLHSAGEQLAPVTQWPFLWLPKTGILVAVSEIVCVSAPVLREREDHGAYVTLKAGPNFLAHPDDWPLIQATLSPPEVTYVEARP